MFRLVHEFLPLAFIGLWAYSLSAMGNDIEFKADCAKQLMSAWKELVVTEKIGQLLGLMRKYHPDTPYCKMDATDGTGLADEIEKQVYPKEECGKFMKPFMKGLREVSCMEDIPVDDYVLCRNERYDELMAAGHACMMFYEAFEDDNLVEETTSWLNLLGF